MKVQLENSNTTLDLKSPSVFEYMPNRESGLTEMHVLVCPMYPCLNEHSLELNLNGASIDGVMYELQLTMKRENREDTSSVRSEEAPNDWTVTTEVEMYSGAPSQLKFGRNDRLLHQKTALLRLFRPMRCAAFPSYSLNGSHLILRSVPTSKILFRGEDALPCR